MRKILLTLVSILVTTATFAQKGSIKATIWDADTNMGIPGAIVEVSPKSNPDKKSHFTSGYQGALSITSLSYGDYKLTISFIGYENLETEVKVDKATIDLGKLNMATSAQQIDAVVKEVQALRTSQKGDTLSYNAGAFKVAADADVEGLLKKMTGITINNGVVEVQGEEVKKIFVDGKEFFGEDVTTAIKSLPAEAVDRVEVFNKLSDQAEFSGMDDGEGYKALNIVTHSNMREGIFGKVYAGLGADLEDETEDSDRFKYLAGGNVNIFKNDSRVSIIGLFNNINQQNFSFEDILGVSGSSGGHPGRGVGQYMVRPQSGVAIVNAVGLNYSDVWGKRDQVKFESSYFFNHTRTTNDSWRERWSESTSSSGAIKRDTLQEWGNSLTTNQNHRLNAKLEWKISDNQSLMSRTWFSFQGNDPFSEKWGQQWGDNGNSELWDKSRSDYTGYSFSEFLQYRLRLKKVGRTITIDGRVRYSDNDRLSESWGNEADPASGYYEDGSPIFNPIEELYQYITSPTRSLDLRGNLTYTEPVGKYSQFSFQYRFSNENDESDRRSYSYDQNNILALTPSLSNSYESIYTSHNIGPGFRWAKERNTLIANVYYQHSELDGNMLYPSKNKINKGYDHFTYFMMANIQFNPENSIRLFVNSRTQEPNVTDLQDVYNIANPQYIRGGNSNLDPSYSHHVRFHYTNSNVEKGRTFMWMFMLNTTSNYITSNVEYGEDVNGGQGIKVDDVIYHPLQYTEPINLDGYWQLRTHLSYGLPLNFMKCNLNLMAGVSYNLTPSQINSQRNDASNIGYDASVTLGSNISENVDFTISWNGTFNSAKNSHELLAARGTNRYFNHTAQANIKWTFWKGLTITASAAYNQYKGFTDDYNEEYLLCNIYVGKKLFKNNRGEIQLGVNDLLNQNTAFSRTTGSGWVQNATNSVVGRYYMVNFVYNLRFFGKNASKNIDDYNGMGGNSGMRRMGPPPGMRRF